MNQYETMTDEILAGVAERYDARVCPKVRIADALNVDRSGLTKDLFEYSLKAHFDFVVIDESDLVRFAVEFDEEHHIYDREAIIRDRKKEEVCVSLGMPLLRIGRQGLMPVEDTTVLAWLADTYFLNEAFLLAQRKGLIPTTAQFDWRLYRQLQDGSRGPAKVYPFADCERTINKAITDGLIVAPEPIVANLNVPPLYFEAFAGAPMREGCFLFQRARCRYFGPFASIYPWDVSGQLALAALARKIQRYLAGDYVPSQDETLNGFASTLSAEYHRTKRESLDDPVPRRTV